MVSVKKLPPAYNRILSKTPRPHRVRKGRTVNVNGYYSVAGQLRITYKDRIQTVNGLLPGCAIAHLTFEQFCHEKNMNKWIFIALAQLALYSVKHGQFVSGVELYKAFNANNYAAFRIRTGLGWLCSKRFADKVSKKDGGGQYGKKKGRMLYYFITVKGQELLNEYHNLCITELENLNLNQ